MNELYYHAGGPEWVIASAFFILILGCLWRRRKVCQVSSEENDVHPVVLETIREYLLEQKYANTNAKKSKKGNVCVSTLSLRQIRLDERSLSFLLRNWPSGTSLWLESCQVYDTRTIASFIKQNKQNQGIPTFALLRDPTVNSPHALLNALRFTRVQTLNLSGGTLSSHWDHYTASENLHLRQALQYLIVESPCLETLNVSRNRLSRSMVQGLGLGLAGVRVDRTKNNNNNALTKWSPSLRSLDISGCGLMDDMLRVLLHPVQDMTMTNPCRLQSMNVSSNCLTSKSIPVLALFLTNEQGRNLLELDISLNPFFEHVSGQEYQPFVNTVLSSQIRKLNMPQTSMKMSLVEVLFEGLVQQGFSSRLRHLSLSISLDPTLFLARYLPKLRTLQVFHCAVQSLDMSVALPVPLVSRRKTNIQLSPWEDALSKNTSLFQLYPLQFYNKKFMIKEAQEYLRRNKYMHRMNKLLLLENKEGITDITSIWPDAIYRLDINGGATALFVTLRQHFAKLCHNKS